MKNYCTGLSVILLLLSTPFIGKSQEMRAFNQNASRSNHTRLGFSISPVYSTPVGSKPDSLLFRGAGTGLRLSGDYYFGNIGIGFSSGFTSTSSDQARINDFMKRSSIAGGQVDITKGRQHNMYFLVGPTARFGTRIEFSAHAKGGVFLINSGLVSIRQRGADRISYRNEPTEKNVHAGMMAGIGVMYTTRSEVWSFGIGADYLHTTSEVNNFDIRRGGGSEGLRLSQKISDLVTGITIRYNLFPSRGMNQGRVNSGDNTGFTSATREQGSGMATGRRTYQPGQPHYGNLAAKETATNCGPVTQRITNPDGSSEEMTFSCPADAMAYARQTQKLDFGERVNSGFRTDAAGGSNTITGTLRWVNGSALGIVTNKTAVEGSNRQTPSTSFGSIVRLSAGDQSSGRPTGRRSREAGSGMATGKRSREAGSGIATGKRSRDAGSGIATGKRSREAGSGLATGRRQHLPFYMDGQNGSCTGCPISVSAAQHTVNPLYESSGHAGVNPMHQRSAQGRTDDDCDGVSDAEIILSDAKSGLVVATTRTEACGDFFFSRVPDGDYTVSIQYELTSIKTYDITVASRSSLTGEINNTANPEMELMLIRSTDDTETGESDGQRIKTKSNIKNDRVAATGAVVMTEEQRIKTKSNIKNDRVAGQQTVDGSTISLLKFSAGVPAYRNAVAPFVPGGGVVSAAAMPGDPIPGLDVKLSKKSTGHLETSTTSEDGEFAFDEVDAGDYRVEISQPLLLATQVDVNVGAQGKAQDHNSSRSNKTASSIAPDPGARSGKPNRSEAVLKSILITADMDGDGVYESDMSTRLSDDVTLYADGTANAPQQKAGVSTSRSNIRTRGQLTDKGDGLFISYGTAVINEKQVPVQIVYRHETAKNSVANIR